MLRILFCYFLVSLTASLPIQMADKRRPLTAVGACSSDAVFLRGAPVPADTTPATYQKLPVNQRRIALEGDDGDNNSTTSTDDSAMKDDSTVEDDDIAAGDDNTPEGDVTAAGDDTTEEGDDNPAGDQTSTDDDGDEVDATGDDGEQNGPDGGDDGETSGSENSTGGGEYHLADMFKGADFFEWVGSCCHSFC